MLSFEEDLEQLLNRHSAENPSGTPDFILAEMLTGFLKEFNEAVSKRAEWRGESVELPALQKSEQRFHMGLIKDYIKNFEKHYYMLPRHARIGEDCPFFELLGYCYYCCERCNTDRHTCHFCGDTLSHYERNFDGPDHECYVDAAREDEANV